VGSVRRIAAGAGLDLSSECGSLPVTKKREPIHFRRVLYSTRRFQHSCPPAPRRCTVGNNIHDNDNDDDDDDDNDDNDRSSIPNPPTLSTKPLPRHRHQPYVRRPYSVPIINNRPSLFPPLKFQPQILTTPTQRSPHLFSPWLLPRRRTLLMTTLSTIKAAEVWSADRLEH
jgi:hypothetical protein